MDSPQEPPLSCVVGASGPTMLHARRAAGRQSVLNNTSCPHFQMRIFLVLGESLYKSKWASEIRCAGLFHSKMAPP